MVLRIRPAAGAAPADHGPVRDGSLPPYQDPGVGGALTHAPNLKPAADGSVIYLRTQRLDETLERVTRAGGRVVLDKTALPDGMGAFRAHCRLRGQSGRIARARLTTPEQPGARAMSKPETIAPSITSNSVRPTSRRPSASTPPPSAGSSRTTVRTTSPSKTAGLTGGFTTESKPGGAPLVVLYASKLEEIFAAVKAQRGRIVREIFSFPGGRRFHFLDPNGNELAVWGE